MRQLLPLLHRPASHGKPRTFRRPAEPRESRAFVHPMGLGGGSAVATTVLGSEPR
jgi:hypothetical protein